MPRTRALAATVILFLLANGGVAAQDIPTPESVLGYRVGADFHLTTYENSLEYFQRLDAASDRLQLREVGQTSYGRPVHIALISSAANLAALDRHREISRRLAHPRGLTDEEARALANEGRAMVWIDGGLHASEVAHAEHTIQLAYDLITGDEDLEIREILDNVILLLWPSINPDGQTMISDWYHSNVGTPYEVAPAPFLYQKYIGHDNNRDGYMVNQIESRYTTRVARDWEPQVLYNHHQSSPFPTRIWIPPFAEPVSPHVHPLMWRTVNLIGMAMSQALEERGQRGATHMGTGFDNWYPGFMDHAHNFHNTVSFLTETALYRYATPGFYTINDFPPRDRELRPQSLYSSPWEGGWWRLRDAVDYMLTASISVLDFAAKFRRDLLYNRYQAGRDVIAQYENEPPYAYFVPRAQHDPVAAVELLRRLAFNGIEIDELTEEATHQGIVHPAGTWVLRMDQEFGNFVRQLFEIQDYPDLREYPEGPPDQPYDVAGWTLPVQMGVRVVEATAPLLPELRALLSPLSAVPVAVGSDVEDSSPFDSPFGTGFDTHPVAAAIVPAQGRIDGRGPAIRVDPAQNNAFKLLNQAWAAGGRVEYAPGTSGQDGASGTSGSFVVSGYPGANQAVTELALQLRRGARGTAITQPRIGLYRPWTPSIDEGWTRWLLERYHFPFTSLRNADVLAGDLKGRYDVIILPDLSTGQITDGFLKGSVQPRYAGGLGDLGIRELDSFVRSGGTLVTLNRSSLFAIDAFHLPVRNVVGGLPRSDYFQSGSIVRMLVDVSHPVMAGMPAEAAVVVERSPVFSAEEGFRGRVLAKYQENGSPLISGYLLGEEHIQGYASAVDVVHGEGRVLLLGMRPQWRGQPFGNFRILFNAALYHGDLAALTSMDTQFWFSPEENAEEESDDERRR